MADPIVHHRKLLGIAKGWAVNNLPDWCDDLHRNLLVQHGARQVKGRVSATTMNLQQLASALDDYERRGWPRRKQYQRKGKKQAIPAHVSNLYKLWAKLGQAGLVENPNRDNLLKWLSRQTSRNIKNLDMLTSPEAHNAVTALKAWLGRTG